VALDLVEGFFFIYRDDEVVFVFPSINVLYYIQRFNCVDPLLLHPWNEAILVVVNDRSEILFDSVCHYFFEDFCIDVH
jgi:hypothetical protein